MARVKDNIIIEGLSGRIGKQIVIKKYSYGTVVSVYPNMRNVVKTAKQLNEQSRFSRAVAFAKEIMEDAEKRKIYEVKLPSGKSLYHFLISTFLREESK